MSRRTLIVTNGSQPQTMIGTSMAYPCCASCCATARRCSSGVFRSACTAVGCIAQYASLGVTIGTLGAGFTPGFVGVIRSISVLTGGGVVVEGAEGVEVA